MKNTLVYPGEKLYLELHSNETINADVACTMDNIQTVPLVNGVGCVTFDCSDLAPGSYVASTRSGDHDSFYKDIIQCNFKSF